MVCRAKGEKSSFLRFVKNKNGEISFDKSMKGEGRGCYICNSGDCLERLKKTRALNRSYKINIPEAIYDELYSEAKLVK